MIGALVSRELAISLRRGTVHLLVFVHTVLTLVLVVFAEGLVRQATPLNPPSVGATSPPSQSGLASAIATDVGVVLLFGLTFWMLLLCVVIAPSIGGQAVTRERERGLVDMLLSTGANPVTIVVAKAVAVLAQTGMILLSGLPALGFIFVFGDVSLRSLVGSVAIVVAWSLAICAASICCSTWARTSASGVITAFVGSLVVLLAVLTPPIVAAHLGAKVPAPAYALNPFLAVLALQPDLGVRLIGLLPTDTLLPRAALASSYAPYSLPAFVAGCLVLAMPLLALASLRLGR